VKAPEALPPAVLEGVRRYARQHQGDSGGAPDASELVASLRFDTLMGCYYFERAGVYHGVELDGQVHT
jgi:hypothetical protein